MANPVYVEVPVTIEIRARAVEDGPLLRARLTREFRLE
jgi:hypothetical protein